MSNRKKHTQINDAQNKGTDLADAVKSETNKSKSIQDQPADEQMYNSFDEIREEKGLKRDK